MLYLYIRNIFLLLNYVAGFMASTLITIFVNVLLFCNFSFILQWPVVYVFKMVIIMILKIKNIFIFLDKSFQKLFSLELLLGTNLIVSQSITYYSEKK